jgi:hypothetical protein
MEFPAVSVQPAPMMSSPVRCIFLFGVVAVLAGCASTHLVSSRKSPQYAGGPVKKAAVLVVDDRQMYREILENHFVNAILASGQPATVTHKLIGLAQIKESEAAGAAVLRDAGADAVLVVRLVNRQTSSSLVRESTSYAPVVTGFDTVYGWYDYATVAFTDMSVIRGNSKVELFLETSLYDIASRKLLWIGLTRADIKEQTDRVEAGQRFIHDVVAKLREDGLLR